MSTINTTSASTASKKLTKRDYFNILKSAYPTDKADYDAVIAFIDHEIELLDAKRGSLKKPTAKQEANTKLMDAVLVVMERLDRPATISEILTEGKDELAEITSNQHMNSILIKLRKAGKVKSTHVKKVAYFELGSELEDSSNEESEVDEG